MACAQFGKAAAQGSNVWSFVLSAPDNGGYISIGFSPTGRMVGSSAVVGWVAAGGVAGSARQYYLAGTSSRSCPPDQGKLALARGADRRAQGVPPPPRVPARRAAAHGPGLIKPANNISRALASLYRKARACDCYTRASYSVLLH